MVQFLTVWGTGEKGAEMWWSQGCRTLQDLRGRDDLSAQQVIPASTQPASLQADSKREQAAMFISLSLYSRMCGREISERVDVAVPATGNADAVAVTSITSHVHVDILKQSRATGLPGRRSLLIRVVHWGTRLLG